MMSFYSPAFPTPPAQPQLIKILSIDGGGIRGLIPSLFLAELERRTGKRVAQLFDLIAGTSTGSLIALALCQPNPPTAAELAAFYEGPLGRQCFKTNHWLDPLGVLSPQYNSAGLRQAISQVLGAGVTLKHVQTPVLVPAYETESRSAYFFNSHDPRQQHWPLVDVALASCSAPTFFTPHAATDDQGQRYSFVDGGLVANNPALCAYIEALKQWGVASGGGVHPVEEGCLVPPKVLIVSLGTGKRVSPLPHKTIAKWGKLAWVVPVISCCFEGTGDAVTHGAGLTSRAATFNVHADVELADRRGDREGLENRTTVLFQREVNFEGATVDGVPCR